MQAELNVFTFLVTDWYEAEDCTGTDKFAFFNGNFSIITYLTEKPKRK